MVQNSSAASGTDGLVLLTCILRCDCRTTGTAQSNEQSRPVSNVTPFVQKIRLPCTSSRASLPSLCVWSRPLGDAHWRSYSTQHEWPAILLLSGWQFPTDLSSISYSYTTLALQKCAPAGRAVEQGPDTVQGHRIPAMGRNRAVWREQERQGLPCSIGR